MENQYTGGNGMENQYTTENNNNNTFNNNQYNGSNLAVDEEMAARVNTYFSGDKDAQKVSKADAKSFRKYGLITVIYAVWHTFCLYKNSSGITYPFYMLGTILLIAWARRKDGLSILKDRSGKSALNIFYIISLMLLSVSKCVTANDSLLWLDGLAISLLMISFLVHMYVDTREWDVIGWFIGIMMTALKPIIHLPDPVNDFAGWLKSRSKNMSSEKKNNLFAVAAGLCIALPMLFVVMVLLASADAVFSKTIENTFNFIYEFDYIWDLICIAFMIVWSIWLFYTVIKGLYTKGVEIGSGKNAGLNPIIAITFTSLLSIVYLFFSVIQIFGLFMGKMTLPENYTYAEYAHEGFYQLLAVSIMNLALVTLCQRLFKENIVLKVLLMVVGACTYIMIASSAFRMIMYIGAYHLTFLRVFVLWFLVVISLWLAYLLVSLIYEKTPVFNLCMTTVTVMYLIFAFANPDYHIAKYDIAHAGVMEKTEIGDRYEYTVSMRNYLTHEISEDAVPAYVGHEELLMGYDPHYEMDPYSEEYKEIRKFNFSRNRASKLVRAAKGY